VGKCALAALPSRHQKRRTQRQAPRTCEEEEVRIRVCIENKEKKEKVKRSKI
jgi:hypothetical protein